MLFELSQRLHDALSKVDISFYTSLEDGQSESKASCVPLCTHTRPAKLVMVKKEGQNKVLFIPSLFTVWGVCLAYRPYCMNNYGAILYDLQL